MWKIYSENLLCHTSEKWVRILFSFEGVLQTFLNRLEQRWQKLCWNSFNLFDARPLLTQQFNLQKYGRYQRFLENIGQKLCRNGFNLYEVKQVVILQYNTAILLPKPDG